MRKYSLKENYGFFRSRISIIVDEMKQNTQISLNKRLSLLKKGFLGESYLMYDFKNNDKEKYLSDYHRRKTRFINGDYSYILNNKIVFDNMIKDYVKTSKTLFIIIDGNIYPIDENAPVYSLSTLFKTLDNFNSVVLKPFVDTGGGNDIYIIEKKINKILVNGEEVDKEFIKNIISNMKNSIACEYINQGSYGEKLFMDSVNTIRIVTMMDPIDGIPFIATAVQRIGTNKSKPVDNWTNGALSSNINLENGELSKAASYPVDGNMKWYRNHPDNNARIEGVKVPNWNLIKEKIIKISSRLPYLDYIGWDIVLLEDSILVVEANNHTDVNLLQIHEPLLIQKKVKNFYKYHNIIK